MPPCSAPLLPARGEKVGMRGPNRQAQARGAQNRGEAPSPSLRSTSPRTRGEVNIRNHSRGASAPELCQPPRARNKARGRRSAERRMPSIARAAIGNIAATAIAADARQRGALAFRRFAADSPRQSRPNLPTRSQKNTRSYSLSGVKVASAITALRQTNRYVNHRPRVSDCKQSL
jgi:hypothetical protein